ncbi:glycosyltransferase 87 family protein [Actinoplanes sp. NPDC048796]|uniref:glycosyltransferase 87 family protein n=1 Tax=unclassified Actinoplanes TaxID=2626549 RepID=UPI003408B5C7
MSAVLAGTVSIGGLWRLSLAIAGVAALGLAVTALAGPVARRYGRASRPVVVVATVLALLLEPVRATLELGGLDLILFGLVVADLVALRRSAWARTRATWWPQTAGGSRLRRIWSTGSWAGAGIGIASALAPGTLLFVAHLALTRQWRAALTALATAGTLITGALLVAPGVWFAKVLPSIDRAGPLDAPANQSLAGVLARLYDSASTPVLVWLSFAVLLLAVGLIRARSAHAEGDEIAAFTLVGLAGAAVAPVSTANELVWALPAILILIDAAARRRASPRRPVPRRLTGLGPFLAAAVVALVFAVPPVGNVTAITVIVLLNALPWRPSAPARRRPTAAAPRVPAIPGPRLS